MKRTMTMKQFFFVLPLLLLVSIFSLYPIVCSFVYTMFDYQLNNQTLNQLYTSGNLNVGLLNEDLEYVAYYAGKDMEAVDSEGQAQLVAIQEKTNAFAQRFSGESGVRSISEAETRDIATFLDELDAEATDFLSTYSGQGIRLRTEGLPDLLAEMRSCVIASNYVGGAHYTTLAQDSRFWQATLNTIVFTLISVAIELVLGMALALIMNKAMRGIGVVRTVSLIPWAIPTAVAALMWTYLYDGTSGVVAMIFAQIGLVASPELLLTTASGTMASAILADVWKTTPYMALLLLAGLQVIDRGLYESSAIDGAGRVRTFTSITLPLLKPSLLVALLFRTLDAFRVYDLIQVLTKGTPETLSIYAYKIMIGQNNYGYGSTIVVGMFLFVALIAFLYVKVLGAELITDE